MVEDVEEIGARLERKALVKPELPAQREVELCCAESVQSVATQIVLDRSAGDAERGLVEFFPLATSGLEIQSGTPGARFGRCTLVAPERYAPKVFWPVTRKQDKEDGWRSVIASRIS